MSESINYSHVLILSLIKLNTLIKAYIHIDYCGWIKHELLQVLLDYFLSNQLIEELIQLLNITQQY